ncbi:UBN2 domain-containing protein [Cephalotus follicularis]|uniref:UBN2 domain-containing protein n=1 Tax=Cephalotus follicularis TaxID=3775 RepID=A0A1Q3BI21_CEPFO|nr:UBN2 domain-containing protein [Cephalotus follicularis]
MMIYLKAYDLWDPISKGYSPPEGELPDDMSVHQVKKIKEEATKNFKALSLLHSVVTESIFPKVVGASTAKEAWNTFKEEFQVSERTRVIRLLHLRSEFANLSMKAFESVKDFVSRLMEIVNQMKIYGEKFTDEVDVEKVLISLT